LGKNVTFFKQRCKKFLAEGGIHERPKKMGGKAKKGMGRRNVEKGKVRLGRVFERKERESFGGKEEGRKARDLH